MTKKLLLLMLSSLCFANIRAMEHERKEKEKKTEASGRIGNQTEDQCPGSRKAENETNVEVQKRDLSRASYRRLFGHEMADEIVEKIFTYANHQSALDLRADIERIISEEKIEYIEDGSTRQSDNYAFEKIGKSILKAPHTAYADVCLFIALLPIFSNQEKEHFLSLMRMSNHLTSNQKNILAFLVDMVKMFRRVDQIEWMNIFRATTADDFMVEGLRCRKLKEIIAKFLFNNNIALPPTVIYDSIVCENKNTASFVRWALKNKAKFDGKISECDVNPLEYCIGMLRCWSDEKWTGDTKYKYYIQIGEFPIYSMRSRVASEKKIKNKIAIFAELIGIFQNYIPKVSNQKAREVEESSVLS